MASKKTAIVIGAGIGGLGTANLLAAAGWQVDVYEQSSMAGGRAGLWESKGFRFDTGPSWYLMPEVFEHYYDLIGEKRSDYFDLERLTPAYKVFTNDQSVVIKADLSKDSRTFENIEAGASRQLKRYLEQAEQTYTLAVKYFLYNPFKGIASVLHRDVLVKLPFMMTQLFRTIHAYVRGFVKTQLLQQILEYPMVFLGTSPYKAPALYHLMSHMDFKQGVFFPKGGMYKIIESLVSIAKKKQVKLHFNAPVQKILYQAGRATGVELRDGSRHLADVVISNADLHFTETSLLQDASVRSYPQKYWDKKKPGPSALLMYLGVKGRLPELEHHNLLFVDDWEKNFSDIFDKKIWPEQASIYVSRTSATDKTTAPKNSENIFVLVPLPAGVDNDLEVYAEKYLTQIEEMTGISDLRQRITLKRLYGPNDFKNDFNAWQGTALGMSHILFQSAMFRPSPKSKKLEGLYYVGGNSQPGIGLPMCLIGAELVYKDIIGDVSPGQLTELRKS